MVKKKKVEKVDWKKEYSAMHCINKIREILKTYWDEDYKLFKIEKAIKRWIDSI